MRNIRLIKREEFVDFLRIVTQAYPGFMKTDEEFQEKMRQQFIKTQEEDPSAHFYGLFEEDKLLGGMKIYHFQMNMLSIKMPTGGVGLVAVDLLHKKEKVAKDLLQYFLTYFKQKGIPIVSLYPFRPDFYKKMGFGYGTKKHQYELTPDSFPKGTSKHNLRFLSIDDIELVRDCYQRYTAKNHGMMDKLDNELNGLLKNPSMHTVGYVKDEVIKGYLTYSFKNKANFLQNDMVIKEWIYEDPQAFSELATFLSTQADQIDRIILTTQEENFHFALDDVRNRTDNLIPSVYHESHTTGVGMMYRVLNTSEMFRKLDNHSFGDETIKIKFSITDTFYHQNNKPVIIHFDKGMPSLVQDGKYEVELKLDIADFSSLLMCAVDARQLYQYGKLSLTDDRYLLQIQRMFSTYPKPSCTTAF